jgi:hypothetical protein
MTAPIDTAGLRRLLPLEVRIECFRNRSRK